MSETSNTLRLVRIGRSATHTGVRHRAQALTGHRSALQDFDIRMRTEITVQHEEADDMSEMSNTLRLVRTGRSATHTRVRGSCS